MNDDIKEELLGLLIDIEKKDVTGLDDAVRNAKDSKETIVIMCRNLRSFQRGKNRRIINIAVK